jgi:hypothetical protein
MINLTETFCDVDDFCNVFIPEWEVRLITNGEIKKRRVKRMSNAEIITIIISFHQSHYRDFKNYYSGYLANHTRFLTEQPSMGRIQSGDSLASNYTSLLITLAINKANYMVIKAT